MGQPLLDFDNAASPLDLAMDVDCEFQLDTEMPVKLCNLPPLSAIASRVLALSADPDVDFNTLAAAIEGDPAFAADILVIANSSLFGLPSRVHVLRNAISVLGLDQLNALAVTVAMRGFTRKGGAAIHQCWRHSAASAAIASAIAPVFNISSEAAFTMSLLHDVGRLGLLKAFPSEYPRILSSTFETPDDVLRAERAAFHVDHTHAGAWLVKSWAFPLTFARACQHHHDAPADGDSQLLQLVKLSCRLADALDFGTLRYASAPDYDAIIGILPREIRDGLPVATDLQESVEVRLSSFF